MSNGSFEYKPMEHIQDALAKVATEWENITHASQGTKETKSSASDFVTQADTSVEELIRNHIKSVDAAATIRGEEYDTDTGDSNRAYIIDPIDGTYNFANRIPLYCTAIAYEEDGDVQAAGLHYPSLGMTLEGVRGVVQVDGAPLSALRDGPPSVSSKELLDGAGLALGGAHGYGQQELHRIRQKLQSQGARTTETLCAIYLMTEVARGALDGGIIYGLEPWDIAPGYLLIEELGGRVTTPAGQTDWEAIQEGNVVFSNGHLHDDLVEVASTI